jgi:pimeloyl-ACP methyl ester carboxylesterase
MECDLLNVATADGERIACAHRHAPGRDTALAVCHGFFKSKETATFRRLSDSLARMHDVVTMDFRGHGRSTGRYTFSAREGADLEAVLAWMRPRYRHIGVLAFSLGAAIAINTLARQREGVRSLIAVSAPAAFEEIEFKWWTPEAIRRGIRGLRPGAGCRPGNLWLNKKRPVDSIVGLSLPVLFVHGTRDMIVDARHSRRLFAAAYEPKRLEIVQGGSHAEALFQDDPEGFVQLVERWWSETLPGRGSG